MFYSAGKDSMALLDLLYPHFKEIHLVFMYFVKDLEHINRYLNWTLTKYPKCTLTQIPHWNLTYILRSGTYCVPNPKVKLLKLADIDNAMRLKFGVNYVFYGMKKADSLNRRLMLNTYENGENAGKVYPLSDWTNKDVLAYMKQKRLPVPVRYSAKASGGVGFNPECFKWMKENYPQDLDKVIQSFPMSEKIIYDLNNKQ